ncbi:MAG: hypothetical protein WD278_06285, partial [Pirellulales bacterium]
MLTQEVKSPRAGRYTFSVRACCRAGSAAQYASFVKNFRCRLVILGYRDLKKDPRQARHFASAPFEPPLWQPGSDAYQTFEVAATLRSQDGGAFETTMGVGVAVIVENGSSSGLELAPDAEVWVLIDRADLTFDARPRDDTVMV